MLDIDNQKEQVIELYNTANDSNTIIQLNNTISIHFRLGDYKNLQHFHPIMQYDYYKKSLLFIQDKNKDITDILFFCEDDDINDVIETINKLKIALPNMHFIRASNLLKDWEQLLLMSCCKHNIIANSSYSWWGAYLNTNPNKIICYPSIWFGQQAQLNTCDLCPQEWNKIDV